MPDIFSELPEEDQIPDNPLEALVGEDKKFKTTDLLARGKFESDRHVRKLESENAALRTKLDAAKQIEDFFKEVQASKGNNQIPEPDAENKEIDIDALLERKLSEFRQRDSIEANKNLVATTMTEKYGDNAGNIVNGVAKDLDIPMAELQTMAMKNPKGFLKLVERTAPVSNKQDTFSPGPQSRINTSSQFVNQGRNKAYYDALKVKDKKTYDSPETKIAMHQDALSMGAAFFS